MHVIDSHTGGMPTRVILSDGPDLGAGSLADQAQRLASEHRRFTQSVLFEPRGQPGMVGVLLVKPNDPDCATGAIFFDSAAVLGMCGHGTIGLAITLAHLGKMEVGSHKIETPAGIVSVTLKDANTAQITNVESRVVRHQASVKTKEHGELIGDVAYGGNWFFIVDPSPISVNPGNIRALTNLSLDIRAACHSQGVGGEKGELVDHVILHEESPDPEVGSRNFVLCPDDHYDRSPCGTGSSARLACLAATGRLSPGIEIIQESVIGSRYVLSYEPGNKGGVIPSITGQAFVTADSQLVFDRHDPFRSGIPA